MRDPHCSAYYRQEQKSGLIGIYEGEDTEEAWKAQGGPAWDSSNELFEPQLDRITPYLERVMERMPIFADAGIKKVVNGAISHTPDSNPLVGTGARASATSGSPPAPGIGIAQGPGCGQYLAQWMVHGDAEINMLGMDPRRYGDFCDQDYASAKAHREYWDMYRLDPARRGAAGGSPRQGVAAVREARWPRAASSPRASAGSARSGSPSTGARRTAPSAATTPSRSWRPSAARSASASASWSCRASRSSRCRAGTRRRSSTGCARTGCRAARAASCLPTPSTTTAGSRPSSRSRASPGDRFLDPVGRRRLPARPGPAALRAPSPTRTWTIADVTEAWSTLIVAGPRSRDLLATLTVGRPRQRRLPVADGPGDRGRRHRRPRAARELRGRAGLGAARPDGRRGRPLRRRLGRGRGVRHRGLRAVRHEQPADGEGVSRLGRGAHQRDHAGRGRDAALREAGPRVHGPGRRPGRPRARCVDPPGLPRGGRRRLRPRGRRAGVRGRPGDRRHDVGRLRPRHGRSLAFAYVDTGFEAAGTSLEVALLGDRRPATVLAGAAYDPENVRLRA